MLIVEGRPLQAEMLIEGEGDIETEESIVIIEDEPIPCGEERLIENNSNPFLNIDQETTESTILDEPIISTVSLPQTGGMPVAVIIAVGGVDILLGLAMKEKKQKED
jgi:hypothetical protein